MSRLPRPSANASDPVTVAFEAVRAGDLRTALEFFAKAVNADKRNAMHRYNFAVCAEHLGEIEHAAREFSKALHLQRNHKEAPRRLASLLRRYRLSDWSILDAEGLAAAFHADKVDPQPLAHAALARLEANSELGGLLRLGEESGFEAIARRLVMPKTDALLTAELLLSALALGINKHVRIEPLLTALRRVIALEAGPERLADKALHLFTLALAEHGLATGYVWIAQADEEAAAARPLDLDAVRAGDVEASHRLLLAALYAPLSQLTAGRLAAEDCHGVKPKAFRDLLVQHLSQAEEESGLAAAMPRLGTILDATSARVARHYGAHPYPRWLDVQPAAAGAGRRALGRFFAEERLAFMDGPFDVLVAGCGTGHQPVDLALTFGANAKVLGIDLSRASLAYGQRIAKEHGIANVEFAEADILELAATGRSFDMIVCSGVLHHMADPFKGWRALLDCLKPGRPMQVALYSAIARKDLKELRGETGWPGPDCSDAVARAWRQQLMTRKEGEPGGRLTLSDDFYTLPEFRDLVLHPSEQHLTIPEIETFMTANGAVFRGFIATGETMAAYAQAHPGETWPGTFASWWDLEQKNPRLFDGMYQLWCEKAA